MRIIAGTAKRRSIIAPKGNSTRPTQDYIRESLFNIIQGDVADSICLDIFAGSGALGLEAISRGAQHCMFCDKSFKAIQAVRENITNLGFQDTTYVLKGDWTQALAYAKSQAMKFDLVFVDPPYSFAQIDLLMDEIKHVLSNNALIVVERDKKTDETAHHGYRHISSREYGITAVHLYRYEVA